MSFQVNDLRRTCRVWPNIWNEVRQKSIRLSNHSERNVNVYLLPLRMIDSMDIIYIEDSNQPLYRAGTCLTYGAYTDSKKEVSAVISHLDYKDQECQKIISAYHLKGEIVKKDM
jgi:hypothetical protein